MSPSIHQPKQEKTITTLNSSVTLIFLHDFYISFWLNEGITSPLEIEFCYGFSFFFLNEADWTFTIKKTHFLLWVLNFLSRCSVFLLGKFLQCFCAGKVLELSLWNEILVNQLLRGAFFDWNVAILLFICSCSLSLQRN